MAVELRNGLTLQMWVTVKALASGADFVLIGRPFLYAMGANVEAGLRQVIELIRMQIDVGLAQLGCPDINDLDSSYILAQSQVRGER